MDVYVPTSDSHRRWKVAVASVDTEVKGELCSVRHSQNGRVAITSVAGDPKVQDLPEMFMDVL